MATLTVKWSHPCSERDKYLLFIMLCSRPLPERRRGSRSKRTVQPLQSSSELELTYRLLASGRVGRVCGLLRCLFFVGDIPGRRLKIWSAKSIASSVALILPFTG